MKINEPGKPELKFDGQYTGALINFKCKECGCDFDRHEDEVIEVLGVPMRGPDVHVCQTRCPNCNKVVTEGYKKFPDGPYCLW